VASSIRIVSSRSTREPPRRASTAPRRASRRSGSPHLDFDRAVRSRVGCRLHGRRSNHGPLRAFVGDHPQFPVRPAHAPADERGGGPCRADVAEPGRVVAHRRRPRVAWPRHLPAISDRAWRAADHRLLAGAGGAAARIDRPHGSIVCTDHGAVLALDPNEARGLASRIARALETAVAQPVLLCTPALRPHLWRLFARVLPHIGCFYTMKYRRTSG
jgi:hypothetical protein